MEPGPSRTAPAGQPKSSRGRPPRQDRAPTDRKIPSKNRRLRKEQAGPSRTRSPMLRGRRPGRPPRSGYDARTQPPRGQAESAPSTRIPVKDRWKYTSSSSDADTSQQPAPERSDTPTRGQAKYGLRRNRPHRQHQGGCPCCDYSNLVYKKMEEPGLPTPCSVKPLKGTSTIGSRGGVPAEKPAGSKCERAGVLKIKQENKKAMVSELRFKAQMIYLGLSETATVAEALQRMEATKMQELDNLRFREWTKDLKGLEFTQAVTVPYEVPNASIVMDETEPEGRTWVRCANLEALAQTPLGHAAAQVGDVVQMDAKTWCLITARTMREAVNPINLEKAWKSLLQRPEIGKHLCLPVFDWYRGQFKFSGLVPTSDGMHPI